MKHKAPVWDPQRYASFWINHASRLLMWHFEKQLRPLGFGFAYFPVIAELEQQREGLLQNQLAERAHVEQPTMAALLTRMERDGLIERVAHPTDKRSSLIYLTRKARGGAPEAKERLGEVAERATAGFTLKERETLVSRSLSVKPAVARSATSPRRSLASGAPPRALRVR